ncbi:PALP-domain-containing protein [Flagelloscypha sp. PMI_526]|nr:PALP-domain-containing protein [Flagelloscypha sp. PMI_526]
MVYFHLQTFLPPWLRLPTGQNLHHLVYGIILGFSLTLTATSIRARIDEAQQRKKERRTGNKLEFDERPIELRSDEVVKGVSGLIGNTPLVRVNSLSDALGIEILGKAEFLNPGGSVKDRVALRIIDDAERQGLLYPNTNSRIFEGTVGSTGISLATIAKARGYHATIVLPDDVAAEKVQALTALGAETERVRPASIIDQKQYVNLARQRALHFTHYHSKTTDDDESDHLLPSTSDDVVVATTISVSQTDSEPSSIDELVTQPRGFFADQFENRSNFEAHFAGTGPEIWKQTNGRVDAFVSGAGTGGTLAGIGRFLKSMDDKVAVVLADPQGSGLYNKVKHDVMFDTREKEGTRRRHQVDTVVEGIGINRITKNIELALPIIDDAFKVSDEEAVSMSRYLVEHDGLFLGSSSACNLVAVVKLAKKKQWANSQIVVTVLCDSGTRHYSKFWNEEYLEKAGIDRSLRAVEALLAS